MAPHVQTNNPTKSNGPRRTNEQSCKIQWSQTYKRIILQNPMAPHVQTNNPTKSNGLRRTNEQPFNTATLQPFNSPTLQPCHSSSPQPFNVQHFNPSQTYRRIILHNPMVPDVQTNNPAKSNGPTTPQTFNTSTVRPFNRST